MRGYLDSLGIDRFTTPEANQYLDSLGLSYLLGDEKSQRALIEHVLANGKQIPAYTGYPYICKHFGALKVIAHTFPEDVKYCDSPGFELLYDTDCIWKVRIVKDEYFNTWPSQNQTIVRSMDGNHLLVINIANVDVLPSLRKNEVVELQIAAFATDVQVFEDENAYIETMESGINGNKLLSEKNTIFPVGQFFQTYNTRLDDITRIHGTIRHAEYKTSILNDQAISFMCFYVDTQFGELAVAVPQSELKKIELSQYDGKVLDCLARLSGDAAVNSHDNGIVNDADNNLKLVVFTLEEGKPERLNTAVSENFAYYSECSGKHFDNVSDYIDFINHLRYGSRRAFTECKYAKVIGITTEAKGSTYQIGTRCALVKDKYQEKPYGVLFVDTDNEGKISRIYLSKVENYLTCADELLPEVEDVFSDYIGQTICNRKPKTEWPDNELVIQRKKSDCLRELGKGFYSGNFEDFIPYLAEECSLVSECRNEVINGTPSVSEYLRNTGISLQ